jgi:hypothetical protein
VILDETAKVLSAASIVMDRQLDLLVTQKRGQAKSRREAKIIGKKILEKSGDIED